MRTDVRTVANTDRIMFGYWDTDKEEFVELRNSTSVKEVAEAAEKLGCSPLLIDSLIMLTDSIAEAVGQDLKDIWEKVNK